VGVRAAIYQERVPHATKMLISGAGEHRQLPLRVAGDDRTLGQIERPDRPAVAAAYIAPAHAHTPL
jgi:hypothetical protein